MKRRLIGFLRKRDCACSGFRRCHVRYRQPPLFGTITASAIGSVFLCRRHDRIRPMMWMFTTAQLHASSQTMCCRDVDNHRTELQPERPRHGLVLIAPRPRQRRAVLDHSRRTLDRATAVFALRQHSSPQWPAAQAGCGDHFFVRKNHRFSGKVKSTALTSKTTP